MDSLKSFVEHSKPDEVMLIGLITNALISCLTAIVVTVLLQNLAK